MSALFSSPTLPKVQQAIEPPKVTDPEVQAAAAKERKLQRIRRGRQSTILTSLGPDVNRQAKQLTGQ